MTWRGSGRGAEEGASGRGGGGAGNTAKKRDAAEGAIAALVDDAVRAVHAQDLRAFGCQVKTHKDTRTTVHTHKQAHTHTRATPLNKSRKLQNA